MPTVGEVDREALTAEPPEVHPASARKRRRRIAPLARAFDADAHAAMRWRATLGAALLLVVFAVCLAVFDGRGGARVPAARESRLRIDPNVATRDDLMLLPGVGPAIADAILDYRREASAGGGRAFSRAEDLAAVKRIGVKRVEQLRPWLMFESTEDRK